MHSFPGLASVLMSVVLAGAAVAADSTPTPTQLPRQVRPTHYTVTIEPDAAALTFHGDVAISLEVLAPVQSITLNALDLKFAVTGNDEGPAPFTVRGLRTHVAGEGFEPS